MFEGAKCSRCAKICIKKFSKKLHMLHRHNEVCPDISNEIENIVKLSSSKNLIRKLRKAKPSKVKEDIDKAIGEIGDILEDLKDVGGAESNEAEVEKVQEQLLQMQEMSDDEEEGMSEEESELKKDGKGSTDPYVRRSLRVYSMFNPSVGNLVGQQLL